MIICQETLKKFANENREQSNLMWEIFGDDFENHTRLVWANFGSLALDLFYYSEPARALWLYYVGKYLDVERMEP